jgi:hypothetical protein
VRIDSSPIRENSVMNTSAAAPLPLAPATSTHLSEIWAKAARLVGNAPGLTCAELADAAGDPSYSLRYDLMAALPAAADRDVIHAGAMRLCTVSGARAQVWNPGGQGTDQCDAAA